MEVEDLKGEGDFIALAPESWAPDYRRLWAQLQAAEHNKLVYRRLWQAAAGAASVSPQAQPQGNGGINGCTYCGQFMQRETCWNVSMANECANHKDAYGVQPSDDTARLDWLAAEGKKRPIVIDGNKFVLGVGSEHINATTLREAIDTARGIDGVDHLSGEAWSAVTKRCFDTGGKHACPNRGATDGVPGTCAACGEGRERLQLYMHDGVPQVRKTCDHCHIHLYGEAEVHANREAMEAARGVSAACDVPEQQGNGGAK